MKVYIVTVEDEFLATDRVFISRSAVDTFLAESAKVGLGENYDVQEIVIGEGE